MNSELKRTLLNGIIVISYVFTGTIMLESCQATSSSQEKIFTEAVTAGPEPITAPPPEFGIDTFYKKYLSASGIHIISSANVPDEALYAVQETVNAMMAMRPDILAKMIENKGRIGIIGTTEVTTDLPEFRSWKEDTTDWDKVRGIGADISRPISTCPEESILCYGKGRDPYWYEDIVIHEIAHAIHALGISIVDTSFDTDLKEAFENAKANDLWANTYAGSNQDEYFAEGVQCWFDLNAETIPSDGIHNEINTREELKWYDPGLYELVKRYFPADYKPFSCHQKLK